MPGTDIPASQIPCPHTQQPGEPFRFPGDGFPFPERSFDQGRRPRFFRNPFLHSALFHGVFIVLILGLLYHPDDSPVKKVDGWVVNIVTALKETPQVDPAPPAEIYGPGKKPKPADHPGMPRKKPIPLEDTLKTDEFPVSVPVPEKIESQPFRPLTEAAREEAPLAPDLTQMRMVDPMLGLKMKYFRKSLADHVTALVQTSLHGRDIRDQFASLEISFLADGKIQCSSLPESHSPLSDFLVGMKWGDLPSPAKYGLPFLGLKINIRVDPDGRVWVTCI